MNTPANSNQKTPIKKKSKYKFTKWIVISAVIVVIAIAAVIILPKIFDKKSSNTKITTYNVDQVTYGNISQTVSGSGTLTPVTSKTVTSPKGGEVEKVNYSVGNEVKENAVIAVIGGEEIIAPCDGILIELPLTVGDEVAQGGSTAMIMGKDGFTMGVAVDETEISAIKLSQDVTFTVDALNKEFTGKVKKISYNGSQSGGSVAYQITTAFDYAEGIYPGMSATAQIVIEDSGEGLLVPVDAVSTSGDNNYVCLAPSDAEAGKIYEENEIDTSKLEKISVKTGMSDGSYMLVESDELQEGSLIIIKKTTSAQTGSDNESSRNSFPGGGEGMPDFPGGGGMDFGDFDFENFDPGQRPPSRSGSDGDFGGFGN